MLFFTLKGDVRSSSIAVQSYKEQTFWKMPKNREATGDRTQWGRPAIQT
jgi:hypothetical protein